MLISASARPNSEVLLRMGWVCRVLVGGLLVARPREWMSAFWRASVRLVCERKKTTPRWETGMRGLEGFWWRVGGVRGTCDG